MSFPCLPWPAPRSPPLHWLFAGRPERQETGSGLKTAPPLGVKFLSIVKNITDRAGLSAKFIATMGRVARMGVVPREQATIESYVTKLAPGSLLRMIGEGEKANRPEPLGAGSGIVGRVFGILQRGDAYA